MAIAPELLEILCCPISRSPLTLLSDVEIDALNARIAAGSVRYHDGSPVVDPLSQGLITPDRHYVYRIDEELPIMLPDRAILMTENTSAPAPRSPAESS